jgi:hypothetical protein
MPPKTSMPGTTYVEHPPCAVGTLKANEPWQNIELAGISQLVHRNLAPHVKRRTRRTRSSGRSPEWPDQPRKGSELLHPSAANGEAAADARSLLRTLGEMGTVCVETSSREAKRTRRRSPAEACEATTGEKR